MSLKGNLNSVDLANIFQMLSINQKEGTLNIFDGESKRAIYFSREGVSMLSSGRERSDTFARILLRFDRIAPDELERALTSAQEAYRPLPVVLEESGLVEPNHIQEALRVQIEEEIYNLFICRDATFEFIEGIPHDDFETFDGTITQLTFNVNSLIMEAARRIDEWEIIRETIPSPNEVYRYTGKNVELAEDIFHASWSDKVLAAIDGRNDVDAIVDRSYVNRFEVCKIMSLLLSQGAIEPVSTMDLTAAAEAAMDGGDVAEGIKFLKRLLEVEGESPKAHRALAESYEAAGEPGLAATHFHRYADMLREAGDVAGAFKIYCRVSTILPTDLQAAARSIELYTNSPEKLGDHDVAIIGKGRELAGIFLQLDKPKKAANILSRILQLAPDDVSLRNMLINVYLTNQQSAEAIGEYQILADYHTRRHEWEQVIRVLRKILLIDRSRDDITRRLEQLVARKERRRRGLRQAVTVVVLLIGLSVLAYAYVDYELSARRIVALGEDRAARVMGDLSAALAGHKVDLERLPGMIDEPGLDEEALVEFFGGVERLRNQFTQRLDASIEELDRACTEFQFTSARDEAVEKAEELRRMRFRLVGAVTATRDRIQERALRMAAEGEGLLLEGYATEALARFRSAMRLALDRRPLERNEVAAKVTTLEGHLTRIAGQIESIGRLVEDGRAVEARELALALIDEFPIREVIERVPFPVEVLTSPEGAEILINGKLSSRRTPAWIPWTPNAAITIAVRQEGFSGSEASLAAFDLDELDNEIERLGTQTILKLALAKKVEWSDRVDGAVEAKPATQGRNAYVATRSSRIYRIDVASRLTEQICEVDSISGVASGLCVRGDDLYVATIEGRLQRVSLLSGKPIWSKQLPGRVYGPLVLEGSLLLVGDDSGMVSAFDATGHGELAWSRALPGAVLGGPVASNGRVYASCEDGRVYVLDGKSGSRLLDIPVPADHGTLSGAPLLAAGLLFVTTANGQIAAFDPATGKEIWSFAAGEELLPPTAERGGVLFVASARGKLYALRGGGLVDSMDLAEETAASPTLLGSRLFVAGVSGQVTGLELVGTDLKVVWQVKLPMDPEVAPRITVPVVGVEDHVLLASELGEFFLLRK